MKELQHLRRVIQNSEEHTTTSLAKSTTQDSKQAVGLRRWQSSPREFIVALNSDALQQRYSSVVNATMAMSATDTTLQHIQEAYGGAYHILFIQGNLIRLQDYLNVKDEHLLDTPQLKELATYIYEDHSSLNLAEFALVLTQIKKGYYGPTYARIDPSFILKCFRDYTDDQRAVVMSKSLVSENFTVQFSFEYYEWAKLRLLREFKTNARVMEYLIASRRHLCTYCYEHKIHNCKLAASALVERETVNTYAIATWLLCWGNSVVNHLSSNSQIYKS